MKISLYSSNYPETYVLDKLTEIFLFLPPNWKICTTTLRWINACVCVLSITTCSINLGWINKLMHEKCNHGYVLCSGEINFISILFSPQWHIISLEVDTHTHKKNAPKWYRFTINSPLLFVCISKICEKMYPKKLCGPILYLFCFIRVCNVCYCSLLHEFVP